MITRAPALYDDYYTWLAPNGRESCCYLQIWDDGEHLPVVILMDAPDNTGMSTTNGIEALVNQIWQTFLPECQQFWVFECGLDPFNPNGDVFEQVSFMLIDGVLHWPQWNPSSRKMVERLLGHPVTLPFTRL